ncbi:glycoside hydrolase family 3 C-terminal domain-containing protein [Lentimicrobium sp. L6]|uniref:beta-glucosidase n=1 Tax=Lentimicrobium sp. L6 TaxID=2735916 RepID=UPI0020A68CD8|nr:glycoside hydrolase family 3 C-terminal domain-containing protein [Lentimicrobium sp. L6]
MFKKLKITLPIFILALMLISCGEKEKAVEAIKPIEKVKYSPEVSEELALERAESIVKKMNLDEKLDLIKGHKGFFIKGYEKYGLPDVYLSDATQGVNIRESWLGDDISDYALEKSVSFPNALELAATWNPEIAYDYAHSIGEECRAAGIGILLGPGMNIYRNSQCGRNFEYMGEDPYLAARIVEQYVVGVQNTGVISTMKHFVANNTDYKRRASNTVVSERALHEIYTPAFKSGVDAGALAVMTSYNQINGEWAGQSDYVINYLLRQQLGFENLVMTDWWSVTDAEKLVKSGQDLEMPGGETMTELKSLVESGKVEEKYIDGMCINIIKTLAKVGYLDRPMKDESYLEKFAEHEQVALKTAREGIVLLRNENNILPIAKGSEKNILITGMFVKRNIYGGGSGEVDGYDIVSMLDALEEVYPNIQYKEYATEQEMKQADVLMVNTVTWDYEGSDRPFAISEKQEALVQLAAKANPNTIVIVSSGGGIRMTDWNDIDAILYNWYPGQIGNIALAEVLTGQTNPSGKLPMTIEKEFKDSPAFGYRPADAKFLCEHPSYFDMDAPKSVIDRWSFDTSIQQAPDQLYDVNYEEGVLVGYRWYDTKNIEPLFPFGFGLSYTSFTISDAQLSSSKITKEEAIKISVKVSNTGTQAGATVAQLYVSEKKPTDIRPIKELKAFKKVMLAAGESKVIDLYLDKDAFAFWNSETKAWTVNPGMFEILIGQSSRDINEVLSLEVK